MNNKVRIEIDEDVWREVRTKAVSTKRTTSEVVEGILAEALIVERKRGAITKEGLDKVTGA